MKNFLIRTATGALFVAALLGGILCGKFSFGILFFLITVLSVNEFCGLVKQYKQITFSTLLAVCGGAYLFAALFMTSHLDNVDAMQILAPYMAIILYAFIRQLFDTQSKPLDNFAYFVLSQVYVALPFALLNVLSTGGAQYGDTYNFVLPLSIFIFIWSNDSGAFCFGCLFGRHKMFERIPPKKTWEGFAGGAIVAMAAGGIMSIFYDVMTTWEWMAMGAIVVGSATLGDLIESSMKREMQIKDSGNILPGHGGMLDRFDSTLLAVPAVIVYLSLIGIL